MEKKLLVSLEGGVDRSNQDDPRVETETVGLNDRRFGLGT